MCMCFAVPHISEHSTTEFTVLANDLPTALSFLLIQLCGRGGGGWGEEAIERGGAREGKWEKALFPEYEQKMEPVSALHAHVLEMTLKSSCNQTAYPRLSLSVATVRSGIAVHQLRLTVEESRCRTEGKEGQKEGRICGLSLTLQLTPSFLKTTL